MPLLDLIDIMPWRAGAGPVGMSEQPLEPSRMIGAMNEVIEGDPNPLHVATSYVERQNWSLRTTNRRYTRLSNGFSRKLRNDKAAVDLHYFA